MGLNLSFMFDTLAKANTEAERLREAKRQNSLQELQIYQMGVQQKQTEIQNKRLEEQMGMQKQEHQMNLMRTLSAMVAGDIDTSTKDGMFLGQAKVEAVMNGLKENGDLFKSWQEVNRGLEEGTSDLAKRFPNHSSLKRNSAKVNPYGDSVITMPDGTNVKIGSLSPEQQSIVLKNLLDNQTLKNLGKDGKGGSNGAEPIVNNGLVFEKDGSFTPYGSATLEDAVKTGKTPMEVNRILQENGTPLDQSEKFSKNYERLYYKPEQITALKTQIPQDVANAFNAAKINLNKDIPMDELPDGTLKPVFDKNLGVIFDSDVPKSLKEEVRLAIDVTKDKNNWDDTWKIFKDDYMALMAIEEPQDLASIEKVFETIQNKPESQKANFLTIKTELIAKKAMHSIFVKRFYGLDGNGPLGRQFYLSEIDPETSYKDVKENDLDLNFYSTILSRSPEFSDLMLTYLKGDTDSNFPDKIKLVAISEGKRYIESRAKRVKLEAEQKVKEEKDLNVKNEAEQAVTALEELDRKRRIYEEERNRKYGPNYKEETGFSPFIP